MLAECDGGPVFVVRVFLSLNSRDLLPKPPEYCTYSPCIHLNLREKSICDAKKTGLKAAG